MSLLHCPECSHEISADAVTCPNCGRPPQAPPVVERKVIITQPVPRESSFPPWAIVPIVLLGVILLFVGYMVFRQQSDQANTNVNVSLANRRASTEPVRETRTTTVPSTETQATAPGQTTSVPGTTTAPPNAPPPDKGTVVINAKVVPASGNPLAAKGTKFYLLDKDLEAILSDARLTAIEGNDMAGSLGLSIVFPDRYGDFQRAAMKAIGPHVKYTGTTDAGGGAALKGVVPSGYSLFAITRVGRGFALWNVPVNIIAGENVMNLSPQNVTEIPDPNG